jgi:8-oxo-dGTP pyrophosphatase MutT (NUDIX family)
VTVPIRDGATVVVLRDGDPGLEVLLLRRTARAIFVPGAYVFPGGAADPGDGGDLRRTAVREAHEEVDITLDVDALRPLARWVTPPGGPRRYDTRFFITRLPDGEVPECDGSEIVECGWWTPQAALDAGLLLIEPTMFTLEWLAERKTVDDALADAPYETEVALG